MGPRRAGLLVAAWAAWAAIVTVCSLRLPEDDLVSLSHEAFFPLPFWPEALAAMFAAIGGAAATLLAAWSIGAIPRRALYRIWNSRSEQALFQLAFGFSGLALLSFAVAGAGFYTPGVVRGLTLAGATVGAVLAWGDLRRGWSRPRLQLGPDWMFVALAATGAGAAAVGALAPETEYDALWYHLWLPQQWLAAGRPVDIVQEYVSLYPLSWEMAFGAAMTVGGVPAAKLLHWGCLPLVAATAAMLTREMFPWSKGWLTIALVVVAPTMLWEATTAYVDLAVAWYVALAIYGIVRYSRTSERQWLVAAGVAMGGGLAVKHLALVVLAILAAMLLGHVYLRRHAVRPALFATALFVSVAAILPAPWYVRAYAASGNPVFPDLYSVFGAAPESRWSEASDRELKRFKERFGRGRTPADLAMLPWDMTVHGARYGGTFGPLFLILVPAALLRRECAGAMALAVGCAAYVAVWASPVSSFQLRFLIPMVPVLATLAAAGASVVMNAAASLVNRGGRLVSVSLALLLTVNLPPFTGWHEPDRVGDSGWMTHVTRRLPVAVVIGAEGSVAYLTRSVPSYAAWQFLNREVPPDGVVLTFSGGDHLYSNRPRLPSDAVVAHEVAWGTIAGSEEEVLRHAERLRITHVLFNRRQLYSGNTASLGIGSDRMRTCYMDRVFEDSAYVVYRGPHGRPCPRAR